LRPASPMASGQTPAASERFRNGVRIDMDAARRLSGGVFRFDCDQQGVGKEGPGASFTARKLKR